MPAGKGTYGSKVGRPPKAAKKKAPSRRTAARGMTEVEHKERNGRRRTRRPGGQRRY
jgi:hypothetical protein